MYRKTIDTFIDSHKEEMLEDLKTLVRIDSRRGKSEAGKPFGEGPAKVLQAAKELMSVYGLKTKNYDNYVVTGDFNEEERGLDVLAHLDVVPVTPDWTVTDPFDPLVKDGKIYGRGTADDKGPAIAALYALRAIGESGIRLKKNVRLILGSDEECGSEDLKYYYGIEKEAPMTFTPDAEFPVIHIEKGRLAKSFCASFREEQVLPEVVELHGGDKVNVVPASAWALVKGLEEEIVKAAADAEECGINFKVEKSDGGIRITAKGLAAHASTPEGGKNAVCGLLKLLGKLPLADTKKTGTLRGLARLFPLKDTRGEALGIAMEDAESGSLTMNLGLLNLEENHLTGTFDSRVPLCGTDDNVTKVVAEKLAEIGCIMEEGGMTSVHYVPGDSVLVKNLLASYETYTGIKGVPQAMGGGTYVHDLKNGVAFGCMDPAVDNHMHGDDEFMEIDVLLMSAKIFADAIIRLCG